MFSHKYIMANFSVLKSKRANILGYLGKRWGENALVCLVTYCRVFGCEGNGVQRTSLAGSISIMSPSLLPTGVGMVSTPALAMSRNILLHYGRMYWTPLLCQAMLSPRWAPETCLNKGAMIQTYCIPPVTIHSTPTKTACRWRFHCWSGHWLTVIVDSHPAF